ncbi:unnamed protein product [Didymodactylos carnosus]|uniref:Fibrinogen C-terminal domain-containing protein n=1 Tax=Didymodactylos carnosus TaxID=1234261 RepID=A0A814VQE7_9BILA|nr:unnamed protein product [Didymodactylos carnosus]CAF3955416.1 unnamed protein product [Didymodactylos carnosus]
MMATPPSVTTIERFCFIFIQILFYIILTSIFYIKLEQFTGKQEKLIKTILRNNSYQNLTVSSNELLKKLFLQCTKCVERYPCITIDCCHFNLFLEHTGYPLLIKHRHSISYKQNRTTKCLELEIGSNQKLRDVFCHNQNQTWLIIQSRQTVFENFNRSWLEYRNGFGNLTTNDYWLGNENIHWLTTMYECRLKIILTDWYNETRYAVYDYFHITNEDDNYRLLIDDYHGNIETTNNKINSLILWHNKAEFSTYDRYSTLLNCPQLFGGGGWWYTSDLSCGRVQLNGHLATHQDGLVPFNTGIMWLSWKNDRHYSFRSVRMLIKQKTKK